MRRFIRSFYDVVTGYILPKFDLSNYEEYKRIIKEINKQCDKPIYIMPILESKMIADIENGTQIFSDFICDTLSKISSEIFLFLIKISEETMIRIVAELAEGLALRIVIKACRIYHSITKCFSFRLE